MRISKVSTGNKLKRNKTFGELDEGDKLYWATAADKYIEDVTCTVKYLVGKGNDEAHAYTDLNPDKKEKILCDVALTIETSRFRCFNYCLPSCATYIVFDNKTVLATTQELLLQTIKKYKTNLHLV